jgi:hypothetical protein
MESFIQWVEFSRIAVWLRTFVWLWPTLESLHFVGLAFLIGGVGMLDFRLLGFFRGVPIKAVKQFMPWAIGGFLINFVTGVLFLIMAPQMYLGTGVWWAKVFFIVTAGANAMFFETRLGDHAIALPPNEDTPRALKIVGAISLFSWFAVLYCGRMLPYLGSGN